MPSDEQTRVGSPDSIFEEVAGIAIRSKGWWVKRIWGCRGEDAGENGWIGNGGSPEIGEITGAMGSRV
jgi:hypothetical protein